jgi:hypothetical protein
MERQLLAGAGTGAEIFMPALGHANSNKILLKPTFFILQI